MYGGIGVEILTSYLETKMPYQELQDGGQGTYLLVSTTSGLSDPELFLTLTAGDGLDANVIDAGVEKITCRQTDGERWDPVWTAARWPGGFLLAQPVQAGAAVLDRSGRFAGIAGEHGTVSPAGSGAGAVPALVGQALGTLTRQNGVLWVTGLPCSCKAAAGELAVTAQGQYWAGQLAAAPQPDPGGLTLRAPLEDTADETDCLYFIGG